MTVSPTTQTVVGMIESKVSSDTAASGYNTMLGWCAASWRPVGAELIATSILVLVGCMSCIPIEGLPYDQPLYAPLAFGFTVMFNIQIFGHISGAHMNPAVSFAAIIFGNLSIPLGIAYAIAQCTGAILGFGVLVAVSPIDLAPEGICASHPLATLTVLQVVGIEIALTTVLNFINCSVWDPVNKDRTDSIPIKFGLAIAGLSLAGGPLTGASMNPARTLGPAVWTGSWHVHWAYWVGPFIGGALPTLLYRFIWLKKQEPKNE